MKVFSLLKSGYSRAVGFCKEVGSKTLAAVASVGAAFGATVSAKPSYAALDPAISTGFASLQTDFSALMAVVYPVAISITVAIVVFGLVKMFIHRSAR